MLIQPGDAAQWPWPHLVEHIDSRNALGEAGRQWAQRFSMNRLAAVLAQYLEEAVPY